MKNILKIIIALALLLPMTAHASTLQVNQGGTGATTLTGCLQGNGTSAITGTGVACGSGGGSGSSTPLTTTTELWIDGNRADTYPSGVQVGSIQYPYRNITAAVNYINASTTITNAVLDIAPILSGSGYTEQTLTVNKNVVVRGNNATIIMLNGPSLGAGTLTFSQDLDCQDCTIFGNVVQSDTSLTNPHGFEGSFIAGNLTLYGNALYTNGAIVDQNQAIFPFLSQTASSTIITAFSSLVNFAGNNIQVVVINNGILNLDDNNLQVSTSTTYAITSTNNNSYLHIVGFSLENYGTGGGINTLNTSKTTPPDYMSSLGITLAPNSNPPILAGTSSLFLSGYNAFDTNGNSLYASTTGYLLVKNQGIEVDGTGLYGYGALPSQYGVSTFAGGIVASSTVSIGTNVTSSSLNLLGVSTTSSTTVSSSNLLATFIGNVPNYSQIAIGNIATGSLASADLTLFNDRGSASSTNYYVNLGIANTGANDPSYPAILPNDGYLYGTDGGLNLFVSTTSTAGTIRFYTGGASTSTLRLTVSTGSTTVSNELIASSSVGIGTTTTVSSNSMLTIQNKSKTNLVNLFSTAGGAPVVTISNTGAYTSKANISVGNGASISANTFINNTCGYDAYFQDSQGNTYLCPNQSLFDGSTTYQANPPTEGTAGNQGQVLTSMFGTSVQTALWQNPFYTATLSGQVPYDLSGFPTFTNNFFYDSTNIRLGIGTSTPNATVTAQSTSNNLFGGYNAGTQEFNVDKNGTTTINGYLGIGTTIPNYKLTIQTATSTASSTIAFSVAATSSLLNVFGSGYTAIGTSTYSNYGLNIDVSNSTTTGGINYLAQSNTSAPFINALTRGGSTLLTVNQNGFLVSGSTIQGQSIRANTVGSASAPVYSIQGNNSGLYTSSDGKSNFYMSINSATSTTWNATGFGISTSTPESRLDVNGTVRFEGSSTALTPSIGGALSVGTCDSATTSVDATVGSSTAFVTTPQTYPGDGLWWETYYSAPSTITTKVCAAIVTTPLASTYNVKIIK